MDHFPLDERFHLPVTLKIEGLRDERPDVLKRWMLFLLSIIFAVGSAAGQPDANKGHNREDGIIL
jgi:hypothetical protein